MTNCTFLIWIEKSIKIHLPYVIMKGFRNMVCGQRECWYAKVADCRNRIQISPPPQPVLKKKKWFPFYQAIRSE